MAATGGIVPSALLVQQAQAGLRSLHEPDRGMPEVVRALELYCDLQQKIYDAGQRSAAIDTLFALWRKQPAHVLWPELAVRERWFLGDGDRRDELFAHPVCSDTTTAIGAYMLGWKLHTSRSYTIQFRIARARSNELAPFDALWVDLKSAFGERRDGHPERALSIALGSLSSARELGGRRLEAYVWEEIARAGFALGELDDALVAATLADTLASSVIDANDAIAWRLQIRELKAEILAARRDTEEAFAAYETNVRDAAALRLWFPASRTLNRAAMLAEAIGDRNLGLQYCRRGLRFALDDEDSLNVPRHMMNIARRFRMIGALDSCLVYQKRAEHWVAAYPAPSNVARMPLMQAEYYAQVGEYTTVDSLLRAAAADSRNESTDEARAELHLQLIRGWMETDRPDLIDRSIAAIADLRSGIGDILADRNVVADLNLLIGDFLTRRGDYRGAEDALVLAEQALGRRSSPVRSWTLARNRGLLAKARGDLTTAESEFRICIALGTDLGSPEQESTGRFLLGSVLLTQGRYAAARAAFPNTDPAHFVGRFTTRISALVLTGLSYGREGDFKRGLEVFDGARAACRPWSPPSLKDRIDLEMGRLYAAAGDDREAMRFYRAVTTRLQQGVSSDSAPQLDYFNGDLRRDLIEAVITLPTVSPERSLRMARSVLPGWNPSSAELQEFIAPGQVVFFVGREQSARWIVDDNDIGVAILPGAEALNEALAPVLADLASPGRAIGARDLRHLAKLLLGGLVTHWPAGQNLFIVPDMTLFGVPWAALPLPGSETTVLDRGPVTIFDRPLSAPPEIRGLGPDARLLLVAADDDPSRRDAELSVLHFAETEAKDVAAAWTRGPATLRVGADAASAFTTDRKLESYSAIHVASHALVYEGRSERATLLLAGAGGEVLTAARIRNLPLDADLVYLSSCEAARGHDRRAGYAGLARSFLDAGSRNVIAPLIIIDDEAARSVATRFYTHWLSGLTVSDALRGAQLDMRDGGGAWSHPFYWAFYQVVSSGR